MRSGGGGGGGVVVAVVVAEAATVVMVAEVAAAAALHLAPDQAPQDELVELRMALPRRLLLGCVEAVDVRAVPRRAAQRAHAHRAVAPAGALRRTMLGMRNVDKREMWNANHN